MHTAYIMHQHILCILHISCIPSRYIMQVQQIIFPDFKAISFYQSSHENNQIVLVLGYVSHCTVSSCSKVYKCIDKLSKVTITSSIVTQTQVYLQ